MTDWEGPPPDGQTSKDPVNRLAPGTLGAGLNPLRTTNDLILSKLGRVSLPGRSIYSSFNRSFLGKGGRSHFDKQEPAKSTSQKGDGKFPIRSRFFFLVMDRG
jgi:hypothetical protein